MCEGEREKDDKHCSSLCIHLLNMFFFLNPLLIFFFILLFFGYPLHIYPKNLSCPLLLQAQQITYLSIKPRLIKVQQSLCMSFSFMYNYFLKQIVDQLFGIFLFSLSKDENCSSSW